MIADWSVDVGALRPSIDVPWEGWVDLSDLSTQDLLLERLPEVQQFPELRALLRRGNCSGLCLTSKVDVFPVTLDDADPEIGEAGEAQPRFGLGSYLDLLTPRDDLFADFATFEALARRAVTRLKPLGTATMSAEVVVRAASLAGRPTFGWTAYALGFGASESAARRCWEEAAMMVLDSMVQSLSE